MKAESHANWEEAKDASKPSVAAAKRRAELDERLEAANKRIEEDNARAEAARKNQ